MDEEVKSKGQTLQIAIYFLIAIVLTPLAIGALASYPDVAWYFGLALAVSVVLMFYSAVDLLRQKRIKERENKIRQLEMEVEAFPHQGHVVGKPLHRTHTPHAIPQGQEPQRSVETSNAQHLVASWHFTTDEWRSFQKIERKIVFGESILLVFLITAFGAWIIHDDADESWLFAIIFSFCFALLFVGLKNYLKQGYLNISSANGVNVLISRTSIMLNGKLFNLTDGERSLSRVELIEKGGRQIIEFTYSWQTRKGNTQDEIRLPVPHGRLEEAKEVVARMQ